MTISSYSDLKASIQDWLHIGGLESVVEDFISLCEADFNSRLFVRANEDSTTGALSSSLSLPSGFAKAKRVAVQVGGKYRDLTYVPAEAMSDIGYTGAPVTYSIQGESIFFDPAPDGTYNYQLRYYKKFTPLSDANTTNWVLTNAPDVYLFGSLSMAGIYAPAAKLDAYVSAYERAISRIIEADTKDRYGPSLAVQLDQAPGNVRLA